MDKEALAIQRGEEAHRLLNTPMFLKAFDDTRAGIFLAMAALSSEDREQIIEMHRMLKLLERVKKCLETHIQTGQITQKAIQGKKALFSRG
jgi:hypothetical protein